MKKFTLVFLILLLANCSSDGDEVVKGKDTDDTSMKARYKVVFTMNWSAKNFPKDYPSGAHFSKLIGWVHNSKSTFLKSGTEASEGIKNMAETGGISPLDKEIAERINNKEGYQSIIGSGLSTGTGDITVEIEVSEKSTYVTLVSMVAPSPDWYVGLIGANLYENGGFVSEKKVEAFAYDAGTDSGVSYTSANKPTVPKEVITKINELPLKSDSSIATVTFTKL